MATQIYKQIHDAIITDFGTLTRPNGQLCFGGASKFFLDFPTALPACEVYQGASNIEVLGISHDERAYGFTANFYDVIEENNSQEDINNKMDGISDIVDSILDYLEKIPDNISSSVSNGSIMRVSVISIDPFSFTQERGIITGVTINFVVVALIDVKSI